MVDKMKIAKLFENPKFRECSIYFYQQHRSVTEVEKLSGISRTTIYNFFRVFKITRLIGYRKIEKRECYDSNYIEARGLALKSTYYYFTPKLLVDWLKELSGLNAAEIHFLSELFQNKIMDEFLRSANSWYMVVQRVGIALSPPVYFQKAVDMCPKTSPTELRTTVDKPPEQKKIRRGKRKRTDFLKSMRAISPDQSKVAAIVAGLPNESLAKFKKRNEMIDGFFKFVTSSPKEARSLYEKMSKANFPFEVGNPITNLWEPVKIFAGLLADVERMMNNL